MKRGAGMVSRCRLLVTSELGPCEAALSCGTYQGHCCCLLSSSDFQTEECFEVGFLNCFDIDRHAN